MLGGGVNGPVCFLKCLYRVVKNQHFQSTLLGVREEWGHEKDYSCTLLIMLTIIVDP